MLGHLIITGIGLVTLGYVLYVYFLSHKTN